MFGRPAKAGCEMKQMSIEELEAGVLELDLTSRARLAGKFLESLEELSEEENSQRWTEQAHRRDAQMDAEPNCRHPADEVFREAWSRLT